MATMTYQAQPINTTFYNPKTEPSPPETYLYAKGAYASPMSQTPPSANISPTNIHSSHMNVRQLRTPRQPLYIPAALRPTDSSASVRPTDIPRPRAPDTPPASKDNSFDSGKSNAQAPSMEVGIVSHREPFGGENTDMLRRGLSRAASDGLEEDLGEVTGPPTTAHWKPDVSSIDCAVCHQTFSWYFRRHHCRHCGDIVCDNHITRKVPLDQNARYHPEGLPSKACDTCSQEWSIIKKLRHSRASSTAGSVSSQGTAVPALAIPNQPRTPDDLRVGSMARSEGMVWSTF